jgi:hypothetical protein
MFLFLKVFFSEFIAEMGDKTQLMLIALASKYKLRDIILGTAAAILVLNGLAVLAGGLVSEFIPEWFIKIIAAKSPSEQPIHTITAELIPSFAPNVIAVSCVLSPNSAMKKVQKTASGANLIFDFPPSSSSSSSRAMVDAAK